MYTTTKDNSTKARADLCGTLIINLWCKLTQEACAEYEVLLCIKYVSFANALHSVSDWH